MSKEKKSTALTVWVDPDMIEGEDTEGIGGNHEYEEDQLNEFFNMMHRIFGG